MNGHLRTLKLVQLLPNGCLVLRSQPRPGFVGPSVVVVGLRDFDVVVEPDDLFDKESNIRIPLNFEKKKFERIEE